MGQFYEQVKERLIRYAKINTRSENGTGRTPSTACQLGLARVLRDELTAIGVSDVWLDEEKCVVYGKIPDNTGMPAAATDSLPAGACNEPAGLSPQHSPRPLGFVTHMDTAPDASGENVKPWVLENYDGGDIVLNQEQGIIMRAADYANLQQYIGQDLVLTDGTTLLGGDDKAGIAAVMTMAEHLCSHPEIKHGLIALAFTPDEEVGGLAKNLDLGRFGSPTAYTLDGDHLGWYQDETFNASAAEVTIRGISVHTGTAKGIMKNAVDIAGEFMAALPAYEKPQYTEGREGFFHMVSCEAQCERSVLKLIIRDHDAAQFAIREAYLQKVVDGINRRYGEGTAVLLITPQYRSMKEVIDTVPYMIDDLKAAISACGIEPKTEPFRGGTDGSALSHRGLPAPNLSAGYENAHGRFEYVPVQSMEKNVEILLELVRICAGIQ